MIPSSSSTIFRNVAMQLGIYDVNRNAVNTYINILKRLE